MRCNKYTDYISYTDHNHDNLYTFQNELSLVYVRWAID